MYSSAWKQIEIIKIKTKKIINMERADSLKPVDEVTITIYGPEGSVLYKSSRSGFHKIEDAINSSIEEANLQIDPKDCVFEVTNETTQVSHKYRLNAHDNLKLII